MNSLYQALLDKVRRVTRPFRPRSPGTTPTIGLPISRTSSASSPQPSSGVIPFAPGRVYKTIYTNYNQDPRPLIFVLYSNAFYTHAININYLGGNRTTLMNIIVALRGSGRAMTGATIYEYMKARAPIIPKLGYRTYFTKFLTGRLVSDGISQMPLPGKKEYVADPFIRQLNNLIRPKVINKSKPVGDEAQESLRDAQNRADVRLSRR